MIYYHGSAIAVYAIVIDENSKHLILINLGKDKNWVGEAAFFLVPGAYMTLKSDSFAQITTCAHSRMGFGCPVQYGMVPFHFKGEELSKYKAILSAEEGADLDKLVDKIYKMHPDLNSQPVVIWTDNATNNAIVSLFSNSIASFCDKSMESSFIIH